MTEWNKDQQTGAAGTMLDESLDTEHSPPLDTTALAEQGNADAINTVAAHEGFVEGYIPDPNGQDARSSY